MKNTIVEITTSMDRLKSRLNKRKRELINWQTDLKNIPWADPYKDHRNSPWFNQSIPVNGLFWCESSMFYFRKRKYVIIGKDLAGIPSVSDSWNDTPSLFLGINHTGGNSDTGILKAIID